MELDLPRASMRNLPLSPKEGRRAGQDPQRTGRRTTKISWRSQRRRGENHFPDHLWAEYWLEPKAPLWILEKDTAAQGFQARTRRDKGGLTLPLLLPSHSSSRTTRPPPHTGGPETGSRASPLEWTCATGPGEDPQIRPSAPLLDAPWGGGGSR
jgi:hypothetical protein